MFVLAAFATSALSARAAAGSVTTEAFVASVRPAIDALAAADALALSTSSGRRLRAFARADAAEQEHAEAALDRWAEDQHRLAAKDAAAPTLDGLNQLTGLFAVPYGLVADATAIAGPPLTPLPAADLARAAARRELDRLATLGEPSFDAAYAADQAATLERLADTYDGFIRNGDDTTLRRLAVLALPRIRRLIDDLRRL
jgi:predicted outer membrane protein